MATKAQAFRAQQQRDVKPDRPKAPARPRRDVGVDTSLPGVSATARRATPGPSGSLNENARAARRGGAKLEVSTDGRPSRKSTRKSADGTKPTSNLQRRAIRATAAPAARASRAKARSS
ncbi:MAG: hypothetical protein IT376_19225 [Polyangiaceae bacterium]|nr:hypothetical protein [Polyangiaceae bacterium]